ncbi:MAG: hypothetical protein CBD92_001350 [Pelagibacteraceae bacterium TMED232]|nr:MAG: hypothetical protein CBD92_001350 [Pelagibacteraceae bacterium TMED232]|tara:strand:+ start:1581 stop:2162 length:582 start_codon:yes stop_codon:yes gene_type:complete
MRKEISIQIFLTILVLIILISVYQKYFKKEFNENPAVIKEENTNEKNNLINIVYESIDKEGRKYIITAETGNFKEEKPDLIYMTIVKAKIFLLDGSVIYIDSLNAEYNTMSYDTKFYNEIKLNFLEHNIFCNNLNIFFKDNLIEAFNDLNYKNLDIIMFADKIEIDLLTNNSKIYNFNENSVIIKNRNLNGDN